ncbi:MAG: hypothetical protein J5I92_05720 [Thiogranum sp.]|nr:hypothetical protein [Thiogranum sp.]
MRDTTVFAIIAGLGVTLGQGGAAAETDPWQYEITPYFLAAGLDGEVGVRGVTADIDVPFSDVWDSLDAGFMGLFTAHKGPWFFGLEAVYFRLEDEGAKTVTGPFGQVSVTGALDVTTSMSIYQGSVGYRLLDNRPTLDLIGALRYTKLEVDADVRITTVPAVVFPGGSSSEDGSDNWTDAVIGLHALLPVAKNWSLLGYADIGAGGSDLTYQFIAGANWEFSDGFKAKAGYRYMYWDYENDGVVWDIAASGPYLGLGISF